MLLQVIHHGKSALVQSIPAHVHTVVFAMRLVPSWGLRGTHGVLEGCAAAACNYIQAAVNVVLC